LITWPAVDVRGGRVVQLVGGRPEIQPISLPDPVAVARHWLDLGFGRLHVVDLDAAFGSGTNHDAIRSILEAVDVPVQVGGGIRDDDAVTAWLDAGAARVIIGTRAVRDPEWRGAVAERHPGRVVVAADTRDGRVLVRGWTEAEQELAAFVRELEKLPLAGVLVTDVSREGQLAGADAGLFARVVATTPHPVIAAGGIAGLEDLRELDRAGVAGAVLGMALYAGGIGDAAAAALAGEFAA
jgi:phosphoribosylformimino-5-aminoimidazole carboxamide ribotide isomerase